MKEVDVSMTVAREPELALLPPGTLGSILPFGELNGMLLQVRDVWARRTPYGKVLCQARVDV